MTHKVIVRMPEIKALRKHAPTQLQQALRKTLMVMEVSAKTSAPVDTGALRASIHMVLFGQSDRVQAHSLALMLASRKKKRVGFGPGRRARTPWEGWLSTAVHYAPYQEGVRHFMRAAATEGQKRLKIEVEKAIAAAKRRT